MNEANRASRKALFQLCVERVDFARSDLLYRARAERWQDVEPQHFDISFQGPRVDQPALAHRGGIFAVAAFQQRGPLLDPCPERHLVWGDVGSIIGAFE